MADAGQLLEQLFDRPVVILAAPRSGSTLLFETMATSTALWTVGGESHLVIEGLAPLTPASGAVDSNRLDEGNATPEIIRALRVRFAQQLRSAGGTPWLKEQRVPVRLLEKTPKNAVRLPFLRRVFPGARYIVLFREARPNIASMIEAWRSGRWVTYPRLPGWQGPPWSLLLPPGWQQWNGQSVETICAQQWQQTNKILLDDLDGLPADRWEPVHYQDLVSHPAETLERLMAFAGLPVDDGLRARIGGDLPHSRYTQTAPDPDKWRRHEEALEALTGVFEPVEERIRSLLGDREN